MPTPRTRSVRRAAPALALALSLSACGGDDGAAAAADDAPPATASQDAPPSDGQFRRPGASGRVAAVDGTTAQVQANDTQTAVSWTAATTFTAQTTGSLADVAVGSCVVVRSSDASAVDAGAVTATSVAVTGAENGECAGPGGTGGFRGGGPSPDGALPSGAPRVRPSGAPGDMRRGLGGALGEVTAMTSDGFTVRSARLGPPGEEGAEPETQDVTVTVAGDTTVTKTVPAAADAVRPGVCVTATGEADSTGAVVATAIAVRPTEDGECGGGFGAPGVPGA